MKRGTLVKEDFQVAIFGSARIKRSDPSYKQIYNLAKHIASEDIDIVTGGGPGLMDAATRGHHAGRTKKSTCAIGLTIKLPFEEKKAYELDVSHEFKHFTKRLKMFMQLCDVVVVAPGGIGTILEFFYAWQLIQVGHVNPIPIILLGEMWADLMKWLRKWPLKNSLLSEEDMHHLHHVKDVTQAMVLIRQAHESFNRGKKFRSKRKR